MADDKKNAFQRIAGDKSSKRILFFIGGIVLVIFTIVFFLGGGEAAEGNESRLRSAPNQRDDIIQGDVSDNYEQALRESDRQRIEQARDEGRSALPSIMGSSVQDEDQVSLNVEQDPEPEIIRPDVQESGEIEPVAIPQEVAPEEEEAADPRPIIRPRDTVQEPRSMEPRNRPSQSGPNQTEPQLVERPQPKTDDNLRSLYAQQMSRIAQRMDSQPGSPSTQYVYQPDTSAPGNANATASAGARGSQSGDMPPAILRERGQAGGPGGSSARASVTDSPQAEMANQGPPQQEKPPFQKPMPGEIIYASMITRADSDAPGPVVAKILQGELAGARVLGNFSVNNEKLMLEFTTLSVDETMSGKQVNKTYGIRAVAVDTEHVGTGIATSVDRHLVSRIAVKASTAFLSGLGSAIATSGQTVNSLGDGQSETETPERSLRTNALIAGGEAASETGAIIDEYLGGRPTTVRVEAGTPLGILFLQ
ncbi:TrbI/VirB10 family protein [Salipiger mucosus]|uniref:Uncharacterized protein n=1 Tax=Salipiger mucosus DSM 16094 TaxID=1123237 RepID=S9QVB1_9RHOB|nr:TrbI/VirB10 family protein [Salipiger mucosus]EPX83502.1 hypothetical protein Salmuc_02110 [Salipiger mucosus DSM 16094]